MAVLLAYLLFVAAVRYLPCPTGGTLSPEALITCATLAFAAINFFLGAFPLELTALVIPVVLAASGVLSAGEAFRSFSDSTILVFGGMFVVGGASSIRAWPRDWGGLFCAEPAAGGPELPWPSCC